MRGCARWMNHDASQLQYLVGHYLDVTATILDARSLSHSDIRILLLEISGKDVEEKIVKGVAAVLPKPPSQ